MLSITSRPNKTLESGVISRWNASATPLVYKFSSNIFPVNSVDSLYQTDLVEYNSGRKGTILEATGLGSSIVKGDFVQVSNSSPSVTRSTTIQEVYGVYKVIDVISANEIVVDLFISNSFSDEFYVQKYYKGYKALVKVFAGSPEYHPYNTDGSKPQTEIGTIEVEFDSSNVGICNVRSFVKPDMSADFDYDEENSHDAWTSFAIEYAEIWDGSPEPTYVEDIIENCIPFVGFTNPSFDSGLAGWEQTTTPSLPSWNVDGAGQIDAEATGQVSTQRLFQDVDLVTDQKYTISLDYNLELATVSDNIGIIFDVDYVAGGNLSIKQFFNIQLGAGNVTFDYFPSSDIESLGVTIITQNSTPSNFTISLQEFRVSSDVTNHCKYSSFAVFGAKQFQDALGGNFGDYISNRLTNGKFLTHFETLKYPFYLNTLIPAATFAMSENGNSVFLELFTFDKQGNGIEYKRQQIENKSDGVYTIEPDLDNTNFDNGTARVITIPDNLLEDGDNGTYNDGSPATWNISELPYSSGTPDQVGNGVQSAELGESDFVGDFSYGGPSMVTGVHYKVVQFDTPISVQVGQTYIIESDVIYRQAEFEPTQRGNANVFLYAEGIPLADQNIKAVKNTAPSSGDVLEYVFTNTTTSFVATSSTVNIRMGMTLDVDVNISTGGAWKLDDTTFKGPIEFLTQPQKIKGSTECGDEFLMRFKNDLGGWEKWNFKRFKTWKEEVTDKVEIQRDITNNWDDTFINGDTEFDIINQQVRQAVTVRSEMLTRDEFEQLSKIKRSIRVQAFINNKWVTVTIKGGSYNTNDESDKVRELVFDVMLPNIITQEQ